MSNLAVAHRPRTRLPNERGWLGRTGREHQEICRRRLTGALSATALSGAAKVTRQAIVKHLQVLEGAGLVTHDKRGREVLYALEPQRLADARGFLDAVSASWDRAIDRLRRIVEP
jgi:DNA-binding transcriptional ArsR family regulator